MSEPLSRRAFLLASAAGAAALAARRAEAADPAPTDDPAAGLKLAWTGRLPWGRVVDVSSFPGDGWDAKLAAAQARVAAMGGGVVFFAAGEYAFADTIRLKDGVILRGPTPAKITSAHDAGYAPAARLEFPRYVPLLSGDGTPLGTAFKGIHLENPAGGAGCGVVNLGVNRGHIKFDEADGHRCGGGRLVFGCLLTNAAVANPKLPDLALGQHPWQRYTDGFVSAIGVVAAENLLVANNRLGKSTDTFVMDGYKLKDRKKG